MSRCYIRSVWIVYNKLFGKQSLLIGWGWPNIALLALGIKQVADKN